MREIEFQEAFGKLARRWPKSYSEDQVDIVYQSVKDLSFGDFSRLVERVLSSMKAAPTPSEFADIRRAMGFVSKVPVIRTESVKLAKSNGPTYKIREGVFANERYISSHRNGTPFFVWKDDAPTHPLVVEDAAFRAQGKHLEQIDTTAQKNSLVLPV